MRPFEITVLGAGSGYGESIIIHLGDEKWLVVDSCIDPNSRISLARTYFEKHGIPPESIIAIVATHWHDDHIVGISQVLEWAVSADFWITAYKEKDTFLTLVFKEAQNHKLFGDSNSRSGIGVRALSELEACLKIMKSRHKSCRTAKVDQLIYSTTSPVSVEVFAFSPSQTLLR